MFMPQLMCLLDLMHQGNKSLASQGKLAMDIYKDVEVANKKKGQSKQALWMFNIDLLDCARLASDVINLTELKYQNSFVGFIANLSKVISRGQYCGSFLIPRHVWFHLCINTVFRNNAMEPRGTCSNI